MAVQYGIRRAPLELIAHVAENDLPYTEILTADYIMANPLAALAYGANTRFDDESDVHEFRSSEIVSYYRDGPNKVSEYSLELGTHVTNPGDLATVYPHAGILNTTVFLLRYPSTATNRNRARSRWTYYHFLGLDVEKSASRTTDPVALADTNNPTLNNSACTVCHSVLDPVAGAFQNYGDNGLYRDQWGGSDSLDEFYKRAGPTGAEEFEINALSEDDRQVLTVAGRLQAGSNNVGLENINAEDGGSTNILVDSLSIRDSVGDLVARYEMEQMADWDATHCGNRWGDLGVDVYCRVIVTIDIPVQGDYSIDIVAWIGYQTDDEQGSPGGLRVWAPMPDDYYREDDTWYRDMRKPGFDGELAPNADNSLQWLAKRIVADPRFAEATVKFWWPAIMGAEVAEPPEDETDAGFEGLLLASNAQAAEVTRLANGFRSGFHDRSPYNLKDLLVEIVLSNWFRAEAVSEDDPVRAIGLGGVGARRLLTPEELARKTLALTGFQWGRSRGQNWRAPDEPERNLLTDQQSGYALLYGGIDSDGVTERARDITSVMAGVAQSHALQSSYPIVMREFYLLPDEDRLLFADLDTAVSPAFEFADTFEIKGETRSELETLSVVGLLPAGEVTVLLSHRNSYFEDTGHGHRGILLDRLIVRSGDSVVYQYELEDLDHPVDCHHIEQGAFHLSTTSSECVLRVPAEIPSEGTYAIEVLAWADRAGDELARLEIAVESDAERSASANRIRGKLIELYDKLHGIQVTADSPEVQESYRLFVEVWERKRGAYGDSFHWNEEKIDIEWASDPHFFDGIANAPPWHEELDENDNELGWDWDDIGDFFESVDWSDPQAVARTWTVVLAYLMMDYRYLYL